MELAAIDRRTMRREVIARVRSAALPIGDVIALDALVEPCLAALSCGGAVVFGPGVTPVTSPSAVDAFLSAFEAELARVGDAAFSREFDEIERRVRRGCAIADYLQPSAATLDDVDLLIEDWVERMAESDRATAIHSRAVGMWASRIAHKLSLSPDEVAFARRCGIIHDIGKLRTPSNILLAARRLNDDEWVVMQRHVLDGWEMANESKDLRPFAREVRNHHERFDGSGYPDELKGDEASLAARIVTVADSFNAMIADRPYRPPMSPYAALEELRKHRGTQFDPECVDAMIDVILNNT